MDAMSNPPVFALVAGEASGDTLGSELIISLKKRFPHARFVGIGGPKMLAQGMESWYPMERLSVMGLFEVLKVLPGLVKLRKELIQRLLDLKPDVFIGVDAPDFNFRVEAAMKAAQIPAIHYVGPSVWAWREKRLLKIKRWVDGVLVLFPFELPFYEKYGIPAKFVGHPLANQVPDTPNRKAARQALKLPENALITGLLPGSRSSEINLLIDVYIQAAKILHQMYPTMQFVIPCVNDKAKQRIQQSLETYGQGLKVRLLDQQAQLAMEASDQLIVTSGTATLEAALMKRPLVLAIKLHPVTHWIMRRLATTKWIGLPNVLAQKTIVPEFIQEDASPQQIALGLAKLISDQTLRDAQLTEFDAQYHQLKQNASELAADAILEWAELRPS
jgi:lipid-A-disaccharide synthase